LIVGAAVLVGVQRLRVPELLELGRAMLEGAARNAAETRDAVVQITAVPTGEVKGEASGS